MLMDNRDRAILLSPAGLAVGATVAVVVLWALAVALQSRKGTRLSSLR